MHLSNLLNSILQKTPFNSLIFSRRRNLHRRTIYNSSIYNENIFSRIKSILQRFFHNLNSKQPEISSTLSNLQINRLKFANSHNVKNKLVKDFNKQEKKIINEENIGYPKEIPQKTSDYEDFTGKSYIHNKKQPERIEVDIKNKGKQDILKPQDTQPFEIDNQKKPVQKKNYKQGPSKKPSPTSDAGKYSFSTRKLVSLMNLNFKYNYNFSQKKQQSENLTKQKNEQKANQYQKVKKYYQTGQYMDQTMSEQLQDTLDSNKGDFLKRGKSDEFNKQQNDKQQNDEKKEQSKINEQKDKKEYSRSFTNFQKRKLQLAIDADNDQANPIFQQQNIDNCKHQDRPVHIQSSPGVQQQIKSFTYHHFNNILDNMQPNNLQQIKSPPTYRQDYSKFNKRYNNQLRMRHRNHDTIKITSYVNNQFALVDEDKEKYDQKLEQMRKKESDERDEAKNRTGIDLDKEKEKVEDSMPSYNK